MRKVRKVCQRKVTVHRPAWLCPEQHENPHDGTMDFMSEQPVIDQDGQVVDTPPDNPRNDDDPTASADPTALVQQPAKVMRIGTMIKQLLDEVKSAPLDEAARVRLSEIYAQSIKELEEGLSPELVEELERLSLPFAADQAPSEAELRIAQAQLVGWLEGLFHGIQAAIFAQQVAAKAQLEQMRGAPQLPSMPLTPGQQGPDGTDSQSGVGHYL